MRQLMTGSVTAMTLTLSACATLFGTHTVSVSYGTDPSGADVYVDGNRVGSSPGAVEVSNKNAHTIVFKKDGYKEASCALTTNTGVGWIVLDVLGGLVPIIVDAATNNWNGLSTKVCNANLAPAGK